MKVDLLTYPLPFKGRGRDYGLAELTRDGFNSGMDVVGVIGYTDADDNPDKRFRMFLEDRKNLTTDLHVKLHRWGVGLQRDVVSAFTVTDNRTQRNVTVLYGTNGPVNYRGKMLTILRIGLDFRTTPSKPGEDLEKIVEEANNAGAIVLIPAATLLELNEDGRRNERYSGVYWSAQARFGRKSTQERASAEARIIGLPVVPVSDAHMPFLKKPAESSLSEMGRAYIEIEDISYIKERTGFDIVDRIRSSIRLEQFVPRMNHTSAGKVLGWGIRMKLRKALKRTFGVSSCDYTWPEGDSLVRD